MISKWKYESMKANLSQKALKFEIRPGTSRNHFPMITITLYTNTITISEGTNPGIRTRRIRII